MKKKIVVGMSGGVDSSVAAHLLKEQGYEVIGVTMQLWHDEQTAESQNGAGENVEEDARAVADHLGIEHHIVNFNQPFETEVVDYFVHEYLRGRTPNPCNVCNRKIKWEALLKKAAEYGADYIATGHYARILQLENGRYTLSTAATAHKDQTYALYNLTQHQLAHTVMPVGEYEKSEVRKIAEQIGLKVADKPDSQEICFIPDHDYAAFIEQRVEGAVPPPGKFVTRDGEVIGTHKGIMHYTIGQRKGLNLSMGKPVFVTDIRPETNEVVIGDNADVFATQLYADEVNCMSIPEFTNGMCLKAKIRYAHKGAACIVERVGEDRLLCTFEEPQRAITPGQAIVFYENSHVAGGATIIGRK